MCSISPVSVLLSYENNWKAADIISILSWRRDRIVADHEVWSKLAKEISRKPVRLCVICLNLPSLVKLAGEWSETCKIYTALLHESRYSLYSCWKVIVFLTWERKNWYERNISTRIRSQGLSSSSKGREQGWTTNKSVYLHERITKNSPSRLSQA